MHIAYYSPAWPPKNTANGIVTYVSQMKDALERRGHRVTVFTTRAIHSDTGEEIELSIPRSNLARRIVNWLSPFSNWHVSEGKRLAKAVSQYCADIDLLEMEESFGLVNMIQSALPLPVVVRLHGPNFLGQIDQLSGQTLLESESRTENEGVAIKSARYVSAPSTQILNDSLDYYGANPKIGSSVYNPAPKYIGNPWIYEEANRFEILHVGRFDRRKGADVMLHAFCRIAFRYEHARLLMVGPESGLQVDTGERLNFIDYCQRHVPENLRDRITFLGSQTQDEINKRRFRCHIAVVPSRFEVLPYSALETLSMGTPLICANGFADNALVIDGETGWHFKNGSPESLADSISKAFESGSKIQHIAEAGRKRCQNQFYPDVIAPKMIAFYETVLKDYHS